MLPPAAHIPLALCDIDVPEGRRDVDLNAVKRIAKSIESIGLRHAISVRPQGERYLLVAGRHRLEAYKALDKDFIPAVVTRFNKLEAELWEIDEKIFAVMIFRRPNWPQRSRDARRFTCSLTARPNRKGRMPPMQRWVKATTQPPSWRMRSPVRRPWRLGVLKGRSNGTRNEGRHLARKCWPRWRGPHWTAAKSSMRWRSYRSRAEKL